MKLLILLAGIIALGMIAVIAAIQFQQPEISADIQEQEASAPTSEGIPAISEAAKETATNAQPVQQAVSTDPAQQLTATQNACLELEARLIEELDDAGQTLRRAQRDYDDTEETYDDALSVREQDEAYLQKLRQDRDAAKEAYEEAEKDLNGAQKRLSRARIECGLFS